VRGGGRSSPFEEGGGWWPSSFEGNGGRQRQVGGVFVN
jgi:hypothetical protein